VTLLADPAACTGVITMLDADASPERVVVVTHGRHLRATDLGALMSTGLRRDGTFLVKGGCIGRCKKNTRTNDAGPFVHNNRKALHAAKRTSNATVFPAFAARKVHLTNLSGAM